MAAGNKYRIYVGEKIWVDLYDIAAALEINNNASFHAFKKIAMAGRRGAKDKVQDLTEALESLKRAIELEKEE